MRRFKLILILAFALFVPVLAVSPASAVFDPFDRVCDEAGGQANVESPVCPETGVRDPITGSGGILLTVVNLLSFVVGVAAVIMIIVGGLKYIMSNGDANSITSAKNTILYAIIGLAIFAASQVIVSFVISRL